MKIGITYDLRHEYLAAGYGEEETAEFDQADTIEAIERTLRRLGYDTERIGHVRQLAAQLVTGARWDCVFNIAEGMCGFGREAQVPALLDAYGLPYTFSDPLVLALALHKGMTKHVLRSLGVPTPAFYVVEADTNLSQVDLPLPLFAKPVAEGTSKGISAISKIQSYSELHDVCEKLLHIYRQPVLVETFLPGREFTVGIVGTGRAARPLGAMEVVLLDEAEPGIYSYANKAFYETRVCYRRATDATAILATDIAMQAWRGLGCRDAGRVDLRCAADGTPYLLEVNPLPGLHPDHSDLPILGGLCGVGYEELIEMIMHSAMQRLHLGSQRAGENLLGSAAFPAPWPASHSREL
jgi:D-alanine-D-alanine ligase